jgi:hypothetical protein
MAGSKLAGQSNTAQDMAGIAKSGGKIGKIASHGSDALIAVMMERAGEHFGGGPGVGLLAFAGIKVAKAMREAGVNSIDDLVDKALLDPAVARALVAKVGAGDVDKSMASAALLHALQRLSLTGAAQSAVGGAMADDQNPR